MSSQYAPEDDAISTTSGEKPKSASQPRVRRRNRMITSCLECRRRKLKCDKLHPCTNCSKFSRDCLFLAPALDSVSQQRLNEIKEKMGSLERVLEEDVARREGKPGRSQPSASDRRSSADLPGGEISSSDNEAGVPDDEKGLEPTPLAVIDAAYEDDTNDDVLDLGIKIGKMRLTERLGGFFRPRINEELGVQLSGSAAIQRTMDEKRRPDPQLPDSSQDFLAPGSSYIAPGSGFIFGDVGSKRSLINFLPAKAAADALVRNYHENVHFIARVVHWPSFQLHYENFWTSVLAGLEPPAWQQSIVLSILFAAVASMSEVDISGIFARPKSTILGNFQTGTEVALSKAQFLRATKLETLQALVIYLIPMCRDQLSRAHSVLVGMAIRLAECMGLHRDPDDIYGLTAIECHVRRIIWFQLCFLDFRTCEGQGPRPGIKREDYDTRFPLNIDDSDLFGIKPKEAKDKFTDMTVSRIRFECTEMQRVIWQDRIRIERKKISMTHVLSKVESFRKAMEAKYTPIFDVAVPIQKYAKLVMTLMIQRMYVMILHRYVNNAANRVPERLSNLTVSSGLQSVEAAIAMESLPELSKWSWYGGAYQQWHIAFLLLTLIDRASETGFDERIWKVIDYVFEPDQSWSATTKARTIVTAIRDRTTVYRDLRRIRVPASMKLGLDAHAVRWDRSQDENPLTGAGSTQAALNALQPQTGTGDAQTGPGAGAYASDHSWSFDSPATLYLSSRYLQSKETESWNQASQPVRSSPFLSGQSIHQTQPSPTLHNQQQQQTSPRSENQSSPGQQADFHSPSDSGTNESWPPLISSDQLQWRTALGQGTTSGTGPGAINATQALPGVPHQRQGSDNGQSFFNSGFPSDQVNIPQFPASVPRGDSLMMDINWAEWDQLFPQDSNPSLLDATAGYGMSSGYKNSMHQGLI
ncbi:hypothetical protein LTR84_002348 [Exophiala bonariae]|uniref:Zn(2)-C6 fungal-type domain-containing protein n=1 Tax=Exophiala bonariae TaxID=1690606 RepID=A0AAV9ND74_9EURO|nr:hypothetical protein LTR84_002348 [Exophiala bonariae]